MNSTHSLNSGSLLSYPNINDAIVGVVILAGGLSTRMGSPKALLKLPSGETLLDYHVRQAQTLGVPVLIADAESGYGVSDAFNVSSNSGLSDNSSLDKRQSIETESPLIVHIKDYQPKMDSDDSNGDGTDLDEDNLNENNLDENGLDKNNKAHNTKKKHSAGPLSAILSAMHYFIEKNPDTLSITTPASTDSKWLVVVSCDSLVSAVDICQCIEKKVVNKSTNAFEQIEPLGNPIRAVCLTDNERLYPLLGMYQLSLEATLTLYLDSGQRRVMRFIDPVCEAVAMPKHWYALSNLNTPDDFARACQLI